MKYSMFIVLFLNFCLFQSSTFANQIAPPIPDIHLPTVDGDGNFTLTWSPSILDYGHLKINNSQVIHLTAGRASFDQSNLPSGTYRYSIRNCGAILDGEAVCSPWSGDRVVVVDLSIPPPRAPQSVVSEGTNFGEAVISWTASPDNVDYYIVRQGSANVISTRLPPTTRTFTHTGLTNRLYTYNVQACNSAGCNHRWNPNAVEVKTDGVSKPQNFSISPSSNNSNRINQNLYSLSWSAVKGEVRAYSIKQRFKSKGAVSYTEPWTEIAQVGPNQLSFNVANNRTGDYLHAVQAISASNKYGPWSHSALALVQFADPPTQVRNIVTSPNSPIIDRQFDLSWGQVSGSEIDYTVTQQRLNPQAEQPRIVYQGGLTNISGLLPELSGQYQYSIVACNRFEECSVPNSKIIDFIVTPESPSSVSAPDKADVQTGYSISWTPVAGRVDRYYVSSTRESVAESLGGKNVVGNLTTTSISPKPKGIFRHAVKACIDVNSNEICSDPTFSRLVSIGDPTQLEPAEVFSVSASQNQGDFVLNWSKVIGASSYNVYENDVLIYQGTDTVYVAVNKPTSTYRYALQSCQIDGQCSNRRGLDEGSVEVINNRSPGEAANGARFGLQNIPEHDPSVGDLVAEATVSGGNASYQIPLTLPPGRKGIQPNLSVQYSSSGGESTLGVGFSLGGLSAISRCPRTFARNGVNAPVNMSNDDSLCLDGQALILVSGENGLSGAEYRTEIDSFQKIEIVSGNIATFAQFKVTDKSGAFRLYGNGGLNSTLIPAGLSTPVSWFMFKLQDTFGNNVVFDYTNDQSSAELLIDKIHYTGSGGTLGDRTVNFIYENKFQTSTKLMSGGKIRSTKQLRRITTSTPSQSIVRAYNFSYRPSELNNKSLLTSVEECASSKDGTEYCRPSTQFDWDDSPLDFERLPINFNSPLSLSGLDQFEIGNDIDGDGKNELIFYEQYRNVFDVLSQFNLIEMGDERPRSVRAVNLDENGNEVPLNSELQALVDQYPEIALESGRRMFQGRATNNFDFNKDGRSDLLVRSAETGTYHIIYFDANGVNDIDTEIRVQPFGGPAVVYGDFKGLKSITTSTNSNNSRQLFTHIFAPLASELFLPGDFNLDGRTDFAVNEPGGTTGVQAFIYFDCSTTTPDVFVEAKFCKSQPLYDVPVGNNYNSIDVNPAYRISSPGSAEILTGAPDIDGNGIPDFFLQTGTAFTDFDDKNFIDPIRSFDERVISHVMLVKMRANGEVYLDKRPVEALGLPQPQPTGAGPDPLLFVDVNGDGKKDFVDGNLYQLATGNPVQPFTLPQYFVGGTGEYKREICRGTFSDGSHISPRACEDLLESALSERPGDPMPIRDTTSAFYSIDVDADGVDELFYPKTIKVPYCSGRYATLATSDGVERELSCSASDSEVRHIYRWAMIDYVENANGQIEAVEYGFGDELIASPAFDGFDDINNDGKPELYSTMGYLTGEFLVRKFAQTKLGGRFPSPTEISQYRLSVGDTFIVDLEKQGLAGAFFSRNLAGDNRISSIRSGMGMETRFHYQVLSNNDDLHGCDISDERPFYQTTKESVGGAYFHFSSNLEVVAKLEQSNGIGGFNQTCYRYKDNMFNHEGRGIQGFERIIVEQKDLIEQSNSVRTVMDFHQKFPLTGKMKSMRTELVIDDITQIDSGLQNPLSRKEILYNLGPNENLPIARVLETQMSTSQYQYNKDNPSVFRELLSASTSHLTYGDGSQNDEHTIYGRPSLMESVTNEFDDGIQIRSYKKDTTFEYQPVNTSLWAVDLLTRKVETSHSVDYNDGLDIQFNPQNNQTRFIEISMDIDPVTRFNRKTIVLPGLENEVVTENEHDQFGNIVTTTQSGLGLRNAKDELVARMVNIDFGPSNGYFVNQIDMGLNMVMTMEYDESTGKPTTIIDANGLVTNATFDPFGTELSVKAPGVPKLVKSRNLCSGLEHCKVKTDQYQEGSALSTRYLDILGRELRTEVTGFDNAVSGKGRENIITFNRFDSNGQLVEEVGAHYASDNHIPRTVKGEYDALGRPGFTITDAEPQYRKVSYLYDGFDTHLTVDTQGNNYLNESTDIPVQSMMRTINSLGQVLQTIDQMGNTTTFRYDGAENLIASVVVDADDYNNRSLTQMTFNLLGQRTTITSPNGGTKRTEFNGLNELISQTDANGNLIEFVYDEVGRVIERRINGTLDTEYGYDGQFIGLKDHERKPIEGLLKHFTYDDLGRAIKQVVTFDDMMRQFTTMMAYDDFYGRVKSMQYPSGDVVAFLYDEFGYKVADVDPMVASGNNLYQSIREVDARGNVGMRVLGNGIEELRDFHTSGQMLNSCASLGGVCQREDAASYIEYGYDAWGDLRRVENITAQYLDLHRFDALHRLIQSAHTSGANEGVDQTILYQYDGLGNLLAKDDYAREYQYGGAVNGLEFSVNQVRQITKLDGSIATFEYDRNGNLTSGDDRHLIYNAINKPTFIQQGNHSTSFRYGFDDARYKQIAIKDNKEITTYYMDKIMEWEEIRDARSGEFLSMNYKTYLFDYAIIKRHFDESLNELSVSKFYKHTDLLGSIDAITDKLGNVVERRSHDPFGKPRDHIGNPSNRLNSSTTNRGFTDQEHLDGVQLIHMNGRVYDFNLGRFLSVDPFVVNPMDTQSYNSYAYVLNNPLSNIDPTGYVCRAANGSLATSCSSKDVIGVGETIVVENDDGSTTTIEGGDKKIKVTTSNGEKSNSGTTSSADIKTAVISAINATVDSVGIVSSEANKRISEKLSVKQKQIDDANKNRGQKKRNKAKTSEEIQLRKLRNKLKSVTNLGANSVILGNVTTVIDIAITAVSAPAAQLGEDQFAQNAIDISSAIVGGAASIALRVLPGTTGTLVAMGTKKIAESIRANATPLVLDEFFPEGNDDVFIGPDSEVFNQLTSGSQSGTQVIQSNSQSQLNQQINQRANSVGSEIDRKLTESLAF